MIFKGIVSNVVNFAKEPQEDSRQKPPRNSGNFRPIPPPPEGGARGFFTFLLIILLVSIFIFLFQKGNADIKVMSYSRFINELKKRQKIVNVINNIKKQIGSEFYDIVINGNRIINVRRGYEYVKSLESGIKNPVKKNVKLKSFIDNIKFWTQGKTNNETQKLISLIKEVGFPLQRMSIPIGNLPVDKKIDVKRVVKMLKYIKKINKLSTIPTIERVLIVERDISIFLSDGSQYKSYIPYDDQNLIPLLIKAKVEVIGKEKPTYPFWQTILGFLPWLLILGIFWFIMFRQMSGMSGKAFSFGKSRARHFRPGEKKVTFKDVAGCEEAKEELVEIIEYLKNPNKFTKLGARVPKGVLLVGPPGTGKTLLARAVAGEANVDFFSMSGSDFVEMFVGVGASRVRDLFEQGKRHAPCIIFIDELDAVGRYRGAGLGGGHDEREQTLNQLLVEMDGFEPKQGIIVMAATNRPDVLDNALLRPGRFDRRIVVDLPDVKGREEILKVHTRKVPIADDVNLQNIAKGTPGFSGADLENLVNEASLLAAKRNKKKVSMKEFEDAKDKVLMGPERRSLVLSEEERVTTAYHEAGHALLGHYLPNSDPIYKITIIPRGMALGITQSLPEDERHIYSKEYYLEQITVLMGGRIAEEIRFGSGYITNGAANDIERATKIARAMVCEWGMSDKLGPLAYGQKEEPIFLGKEIARHKDYSEKVAELIDNEVKSIIGKCYNKGKSLLIKHKTKLELLANTLLEKESLNRDEVEAILGKKAKKRAKIKKKGVKKS